MSTVVGASVVSLTLMACYGAPPDFERRLPPPPGKETTVKNPNSKPSSSPAHDDQGPDEDR